MAKKLYGIQVSQKFPCSEAHVRRLRCKTWRILDEETTASAALLAEERRGAPSRAALCLAEVAARAEEQEIFDAETMEQAPAERTLNTAAGKL